jgi:hypothetical protein
MNLVCMSQEKGQCRMTIEQVAQRLWVPGAVGRAKATAAVGDERHCVVSTVFQTCMSHNFDLTIWELIRGFRVGFRVCFRVGFRVMYHIPAWIPRNPGRNLRGSEETRGRNPNSGFRDIRIDDWYDRYDWYDVFGSNLKRIRIAIMRSYLFFRLTMVDWYDVFGSNLMLIRIAIMRSYFFFRLTMVDWSDVYGTIDVASTSCSCFLRGLYK